MSLPSPKSNDRVAAATQQLLEALSEQALAKGASNPLAANIHLMTANLSSMAHALGAQVHDLVTGDGVSAEAQRQLGATADLYLRMVRQIDRLAHLGQQISPLRDLPARPLLRKEPKPDS